MRPITDQYTFNIPCQISLDRSSPSIMYHASHHLYSCLLTKSMSLDENLQLRKFVFYSPGLILTLFLIVLKSSLINDYIKILNISKLQIVFILNRQFVHIP